MKEPSMEHQTQLQVIMHFYLKMKDIPILIFSQDFRPLHGIEHTGLWMAIPIQLSCTCSRTVLHSFLYTI